MSHIRHHADLGSWRRLKDALSLDPKDVSVILIFALCVGILSIVAPAAIETLVNTVAFGVLLWPVIALALVMLSLLLISASLKALQFLVAEYLQRRLFVRYAEKFAKRFSRAEMQSFQGRNAGDLADRFFEVSGVQKALASLLVDGVAVVMITLVGLVLLSCYHPYLLTFAVLLIVSVGTVTLLLGTGAVSSSIEESYAKFDLAAWLGEIARSPRLFRTGAGRDLAIDRARSLTAEYVAARKTHFRVVWRQTLFVLLLEAGASTLLLGLGGWLVINRQLTLGQLVASELIVTLVLAALAKSGKHLESFYDLEASLDKLGVVDTFAIEVSGAEVLAPSSKPLSVKAVVPAKSGTLSLDIAPGARVALLGPAGSGKTRLLETLALLHAPEGLSMDFDGVDTHSLDRARTRQLVAYSGRNEIFAGTILENIRAGRSDISVEEARRALDDAGLGGLVSRLPKGMGTPLASDGFPLSSTEAALLGLARAIAAKPRLLLVDGTLDLLEPELRTRLVASLTSPGSSWTLVLGTTRPEIASLCGSTVTLP